MQTFHDITEIILGNYGGLTNLTLVLFDVKPDLIFKLLCSSFTVLYKVYFILVDIYIDRFLY